MFPDMESTRQLECATAHSTAEKPPRPPRACLRLLGSRNEEHKVALLSGRQSVPRFLGFRIVFQQFFQLGRPRILESAHLNAYRISGINAYLAAHRL